MGGWWRWALVTVDGVVPSRMVSVSASVNLPLHHDVQKFSSGTGSPGWSRQKGRKTAVVVKLLWCLTWVMNLAVNVGQKTGAVGHYKFKSWHIFHRVV